MSHRVLSSVLAGVLSSATALAQEAPTTNAECVRAYEDGQVQRQSGRLVEARSALQLCARDECPDFIRADCVSWYGEVQGEVPTLVFAARSQGRDLADVRISLGERVMTARLDGQAIELDPGEYDFHFEAAGMQPLTQRSVIVRGERNRLIQVELTPVASAKAVDAPQAPAAPARSLLVPGIFAGVGVAGLAGFGLLAGLGRSSESKLEKSCSPNCGDAQLSGVKTKYLLADVSLGVGVASLALGAYFLLSQPSGAAAARTPALNLQANADGAGFVYGGTF